MKHFLNFLVDLIIYINENYDKLNESFEDFDDFNEENSDEEEKLKKLGSLDQSSQDLIEFSSKLNLSGSGLRTEKPAMEVETPNQKESQKNSLKRSKTPLKMSESLMTADAKSSLCDSVSTNADIGCFTAMKKRRKLIHVFNVKIESLADLRSSVFSPKKGELKKEAIASDVVITFDCKMQNYRIGCKKLTGQCKFEFYYDFIKYKSVKNEKNLDWITLMEFSR